MRSLWKQNETIAFSCLSFFSSRTKRRTQSQISFLLSFKSDLIELWNNSWIFSTFVLLFDLRQRNQRALSINSIYCHPSQSVKLNSCISFWAQTEQIKSSVNSHPHVLYFLIWHLVGFILSTQYIFYWLILYYRTLN